MALSYMVKAAGMSRTAFAQRFHALAQQTPMHYLTMWRMQKAKEMLRSGNLSMLTIAEAVGYQSEASFGKAFKKCMGVSPGACRREQRKLNFSADEKGKGSNPSWWPI